MSTEISYWGGASVRDGRTRKLNASSFRELVERYIQIAVPHPMTRKEFFAQTEGEQNQSKDGAYICACSFDYESEGRRCDEAATHSVAMVLDLDEGDFLRDIDESPQTIGDALFPYNFVCWRTAKSTPEKPRLKIMVDVSPVHPSEHKRILRFIVSRLGLPNDFKGVKESSVISQAQYRPLVFRGQSESPVIASNLTGIPVHVSDLPEVEEDDTMVEFRTYAGDTSDDDTMSLAFLPVHGITTDDIDEPLNTIDPDSTRPVWRDVAAALRHQFIEEEQAQVGFEKFVEWSSRGTKYAGRKDCWAMWKSLRSHVKGRAPVTLRTLFKYAQDAGWDNSKAAAKVAQTVEAWLAATEDRDVLMQEGAKRIAAMPFKNDVVEESLVNAWRKRLHDLGGGDNIDKATLKKEIAKVRRAEKQSKVDTGTPAWLHPIVYVATSDTFNNLGNGVALKPGAFDRFFAKELMPKDDIPPTGMPVMQPAAYALNVLKILRVEETLYDPTRKADDKLFTDEQTGKLILNTYDFNSIPVADPEHSERAGKLLYQSVAPLVKEPHLQEMLLDYLALQCHFPGRKIPWSFLIQSGPGAGKGTLGEIMEAVLGAVNVKIISPIQMAANFNEWASGSVFGIFNEVHIPGERRDQVMNSIKPCISDTIISLNLKHRDGENRSKNFTNYLSFTNFKDAAHLAAEDRRWGIIFAPTQTRLQAIALQESGHFEQIRWLITSEGASALRYFLMKRVISPDFPLVGHAPNTSYREEVVAQSKNQLQVLIEDLIEDGEEPLVAVDVLHDGKLKDVLCRTSKDAALLPRYLSLMGFEREGKRVMLDATRGHIWTHTEKWKGGDAVKVLKARLKNGPELDDPEFE